MKKLLLLFLIPCFGKIYAQQLVVPAGHTAMITAAVFSMDGKYAATSSDDNTIKLWEVSSGKLLHTLYGHQNIVYDLAFSPDGKYLASASYRDAVAYTWEVSTGRKLAILDSATNYLVQLPVFSKNSQHFITPGEDKVYMRTPGGSLLKTFEADTKLNSDRFRLAGFTDSDKKVFALTDSGKLYCWDRVTGTITLQLSTTITNPANIIQHADGRSMTVYNASTIKVVDLISRKARTAYTFKDNDNNTIVSKDGNQLFRTSLYKQFEIRGNDTLSIDKYYFRPSMVNFVTGKETLLESDYTGDIRELVADENFEHVVIASDTAFFFLERKGNRYVLTSTRENEIKGFERSAFIHASGQYAMTNAGRAAIIHDNKGNVLRELRGDIFFDRQPSFSSDGKLIFSGTETDTRCWSIEKGKYTSGCYGEVFNSILKKKPHITEQQDETSKQWYVVNEKDTVLLEGYNENYLRTYLAPHTRYIVGIGVDSITRVWNYTGKLVFKLPYKSSFIPVFNRTGDKVALVKNYYEDYLSWQWEKMEKESNGESVTDTPDFKGFTVNIINLQNGQRVFTYTEPEITDHEIPISFSNRAEYFSIYGNKTLTWDANTWQAVVIPIHCGTYSNAALSFNSTGELVLIGCSNTVSLYNRSKQNIVYTLEGSISYFDFSNDDKYILATSADKRMRIMDAATGNMLYTYFPFADNEFLVMDQYGHFDGSEQARKKLYFNCNNELVDLLQVKDQLWVPGLAERVMKKEIINAPKLNELNICGLTPVIRDIGGDDKKYRFHLAPRNGGLGETIVYVNNIEIKKFQRGDLVKDKDGYLLEFPKVSVQSFFADGSNNEISVRAFDTTNQVASRGLSLRQTANTKKNAPPNLYALMVGVSDYKGDDLDLKYAAKDATDLSAAIGASARKLLNTDGKEHVFIYNLVTASERYLLPEKNSIRQTLAEIGARSKPNDIILLFFAGHGVMEGNKKQFYFLTSDASRNADVIATGISTAELTEWMKPANISAQKRILILDACNSGQAINDIVRFGKDDEGYVAARNDNNSQQVKAIDKLNERSGMFILSASASDQSAYELSRYSQGLLTYALLKVMREQPSVLEDEKYLDVYKWFHEAEKKVTELVSNTGNRQDPKISATNSFNIGIIDADVIGAIQVAQEKPLFSASNFQNNDESISDDNLELSNLVNNELFTNAARGAESHISYITVTHSPDAYSLTGRYETRNDSVIVKVNLKQNKKIMHRFEVTGSIQQLQELAVAVVKKAAELVR